MATPAKHGIDLLEDPLLNKSTAFTEAEKEAFGLVGLVPDVTETEDLQLQRVMLQLAHPPQYLLPMYLDAGTNSCAARRVTPM
jgi:hypothetical protein